MVPSLNEPAGGLSTLSELQLPNTGITSLIGCLQGLRQRFRTGKISDQDIELILSSGETKFNLNYSSVWRAWDSCIVCSKSFLSGGLDVLDFWLKSM